jgi:hypothetical protein
MAERVDTLLLHLYKKRMKSADKLERRYWSLVAYIARRKDKGTISHQR